MRRVLIRVVTVLALGAALAGCGDEEPESPGDTETSKAAPPDARERSKLFSASAQAGLAAPEAPLGVMADVTPKIVAKSVRLEVEGALTDVGCFADASYAPEEASRVDCSEPHMTEVYAVIPMDDRWPDDYAAYAEGTETGTLWRAWGQRTCDALLMQANGSQAVADALGLVDAAVYPSGFTLNGFATSSPSAWAAGDKNTYCVTLTTDEREATGSWTSTLMSADRPDVLTWCKGYADGEWPLVPCSEQHWREEAFYVNAAAVMADDFLDSLDPAAVTDDQWAALDGLCGLAEEAVLGAQRDDLKMFAEVSPGYWGDVPGWYPVNCGIVPEDSTLDLVGSVLGVGEGDIEMVPTAVPAS